MSDDYYTMLELSSNATADEIRVAIREQRRVWVRRQSSPDPDRRTSAEQRVRDLDSAEKVLLDASARADYDRRVGQPRTTSKGSANTDSSRRGEPARRRTPGSAGSAGSGRPNDPSDPRGWLEQAAQAAERQDHEAAIQAYVQVIRLAPDNLDARRGLARSYLFSEQYRQAVTEYEAVLASEPEDGSARAGLAECYLHTERVEEGLATLKELVEADPENLDLRLVYAFALYQQAWDGLAELSDGRVVMSWRQVRLVRRNERKIRDLGIDDPQVENCRTQLESLLRDALQRRKVFSNRKRYYAAAAVVSLVLALAGPTQFSQVSGALFLAFVAWVYVQRHRPPMWRVRRKQLRRQTLQRGI